MECTQMPVAVAVWHLASYAGEEESLSMHFPSPVILHSGFIYTVGPFID